MATVWQESAVADEISVALTRVAQGRRKVGEGVGNDCEEDDDDCKGMDGVP